MAFELAEGAPVLVDTDVFSWLRWERGPWEAWADLLDGHPFVLSFATVGELRSGALKAGWGARRSDELDRAIKACVVIPANDRVTTQFAALHARFNGRLKGGGVNDMWIASCALVESPALPIATGNTTDFGTIASEFPIEILRPDVDA